MPATVDFAAPLRATAGVGGSTLIHLPFDAKALFGRVRCPVRVTINGHTWRTTTQAYGDGYQLAVNAEARAAAGIEAGDTVHVQVKRDDSVRVADLPAELAAGLRADPVAKDAFESLTETHRREIARWVSQARLPATRARRSEAALQRVRASARAVASA